MLAVSEFGVSGLICVLGLSRLRRWKRLDRSSSAKTPKCQNSNIELIARSALAARCLGWQSPGWPVKKMKIGLTPQYCAGRTSSVKQKYHNNDFTTSTLGEMMANGIPRQALKTGGTRDMLQKELYVISTRLAPGVPLEKMRDVVPAHLAFQVDLENRGIMFGAGPLFPPDSDVWQGDGLVIIRAQSIEEAKTIAAADPMHSSGIREYKVCEWMMNEGSITVKMFFSTGKGQLV